MVVLLGWNDNEISRWPNIVADTCLLGCLPRCEELPLQQRQVNAVRAKKLPWSCEKDLFMSRSVPCEALIDL